MKSDGLNILALVLAVLLLGAGGPWLMRELRTLPRPINLAARADSRIVTLEVGGMTCQGCASAVMAQLNEVHGVRAADVRVREKRAYVVCDPGVADTALTAAVQRAGPGFLAAVARR
ncbi:MAG TPA: heavy metal-associated domain-containing protein [Candidatus Sulfotelmatobacter sp.]|nr:heavy metal-associated domain-containing protein [Candidatus Sulfotelmatobacter sp.]